MKQIFYLTSVGLKIIAALLFLSLSSLTAIFVVFKSQVPWYAIAISAIIAFVFLMTNYIFFFNRIVVDIDKKIIKVQNLKLKTIDLNDILVVEIVKNSSIDINKYCFIVFKLRNNESYKASGFSSIRKIGVKKTEMVVSELNKILARTNGDGGVCYV